LRRITVFMLLCAMGLAGLAQTAVADPINAKNSFTLTATCGDETVQLVVNGNGEFSPGHVVGSAAVFVPQSFDLAFEFTTPEGETFTDVEQASKPNVEQGQPLVTCTFDQTETSPEGTFHVSGTVTGFFTS
jgi:hypothetical protein